MRKEAARIRKPDYTYMALDDGFEFGWNDTELNCVLKHWPAGTPGNAIAYKLNRDPDELAVLIISLRREGIIQERLGGWKGTRAKIQLVGRWRAREDKKDDNGHDKKDD